MYSYFWDLSEELIEKQSEQFTGFIGEHVREDGVHNAFLRPQLAHRLVIGFTRVHRPRGSWSVSCGFVCRRGEHEFWSMGARRESRAGGRGGLLLVLGLHWGGGRLRLRRGRPAHPRRPHHMRQDESPPERALVCDVELWQTRRACHRRERRQVEAHHCSRRNARYCMIRRESSINIS